MSDVREEVFQTFAHCNFLLHVWRTSSVTFSRERRLLVTENPFGPGATLPIVWSITAHVSASGCSLPAVTMARNMLIGCFGGHLSCVLPDDFVRAMLKRPTTWQEHLDARRPAGTRRTRAPSGIAGRPCAVRRNLTPQGPATVSPRSRRARRSLRLRFRSLPIKRSSTTATRHARLARVHPSSRMIRLSEPAPSPAAVGQRIRSRRHHDVRRKRGGR